MALEVNTAPEVERARLPFTCVFAFVKSKLGGRVGGGGAIKVHSPCMVHRTANVLAKTPHSLGAKHTIPARSAKKKTHKSRQA